MNFNKKGIKLIVETSTSLPAAISISIHQGFKKFLFQGNPATSGDERIIIYSYPATLSFSSSKEHSKATGAIPRVASTVTSFPSFTLHLAVTLAIFSKPFIARILNSISVVPGISALVKP